MKVGSLFTGYGGLDGGHVTGHGLSSAKELKMLGNGVVPQQARAAIQELLGRI